MPPHHLVSSQTAGAGSHLRGDRRAIGARLPETPTRNPDHRIPRRSDSRVPVDRRIFLAGVCAQAADVGWVCQFLRWQRGYVIPSSAAFGKIGDAYVADIHRWAKEHQVPVIHFGKGENKGSEIRRSSPAPRGRHRPRRGSEKFQVVPRTAREVGLGKQ